MNRRVPISSNISWKSIVTDLSLAITWPVSFIEWADQEYTAAVTIDWVMWSNDVVVSVDLPSWISFVSASDWWTHSNWTITWNLWDTIANKNLTFTVGSTTPAEYVLSWEITAGYSNKWTKVASKTIDVLVTLWWDVELRVTLPDSGTPEASGGFSWTQSGNLYNEITFDIQHISWTTWKMWTIPESSLILWDTYTWLLGSYSMNYPATRNQQNPFVCTFNDWR